MSKPIPLFLMIRLACGDCRALVLFLHVRLHALLKGQILITRLGACKTEPVIIGRRLHLFGVLAGDAAITKAIIVI